MQVCSVFKFINIDPCVCLIPHILHWISLLGVSTLVTVLPFKCFLNPLSVLQFFKTRVSLQLICTNFLIDNWAKYNALGRVTYTITKIVRSFFRCEITPHTFMFRLCIKEIFMSSSSVYGKMTIANKFRVNPIYYSDYSDTILGF